MGGTNCLYATSTPFKQLFSPSSVQLKLYLELFKVSYGASSEKLSDTEVYPSFYRTVPSDKNLVEAVVLLLNKFGWNWIATIGSDDEYGRGAQGLFLSTAGNHSICIAFEGLIPTDLADPKAQKQLEDTIRLINNTKVNIIVLFAFSQPAQALLEQSIRMGLSEKVWIGTEAWILSDITASIPNIQSIGTVLGFIMKAGTVPGFQQYVADLFTSVQQDKFCQESREFNHLVNSDVLGALCEECDRISLHDVSSLLTRSQIQPVYVAVYSVAHALHRALGCTHHACPRASPVRSWQCYERSERYLFWDEPLTIALLTLMSITISLTCLTAALFLKSLQTPLVQASGGQLNLFALFALTLLCLSCCLYIGKPSNTLCMIQQIVYALCLNGCFSTFFVKSLEITLVTEFPRCAPTFLRWVTGRRAWLLVALCLLAECSFCVCYLHLGPDSLQSDYKSLPTEVLLVCKTRSWLAFALMHGYNGCVALVCFLCTFMVQTSGKKYNIARGITFAILTYFIIWIFFVAIFATLKTVLRSVTQIGTALATSLGILGTYYIPKCYIILCKPDLNTVDYFQYSIKEEPEEDSQ
ncbi:taste receptor type 1 member 3 [Limosa lapponica baueri]|uniref:Taste receptor type 1 member 3 n=1 Tax=Limosa lapponica baueri TaxID=1758121 RepID=A0A2I0TJ54_LIMLA|nr:taste receptor type 1 member 3 [Limosa lapponica baueri]